MLSVRHVLYCLLFCLNFACTDHHDVITSNTSICYQDVTVNDTKLRLNQTTYNDIITIYGDAPRLTPYIEWPFDSICYKDQNDNYIFFIFNGFENDTLIRVGITSLMHLSTDGNICSLINTKLLKLNHHSLGEINPIKTDKTMLIRLNQIEEKPYCTKGGNSNSFEESYFYKNNLIKYTIFTHVFE